MVRRDIRRMILEDTSEVKWWVPVGLIPFNIKKSERTEAQQRFVDIFCHIWQWDQDRLQRGEQWTQAEAEEFMRDGYILTDGRLVGMSPRYPYPINFHTLFDLESHPLNHLTK